MYFDNEDRRIYDNAILFSFGAADQVRHHFTNRQKPAFFEAHEWESDSGTPFELVLWHGQHARLAFIGDQESDWRGIVWGRLFDTVDGTSQTAIGDLLTFARSGETHRLRQLGGLFVTILFSGQSGLLYIVNDCLGVRPLFIYEKASLLLGASHALLLSDHIEGEKRAHMGAVSQYLLYGYNATRSSLLDGVYRPPPSSVTRWREGRCDSHIYAPSAKPQTAIGNAAMAERVHPVVSTSYVHWTKDEHSLVIGLSGGYDSRYLTALATRNATPKQRFVNVSSEPGETINAQATASSLNLDLDVLAVYGSIWDAYAPEDVFHGRPDGFPVTKSVCRLVAREAPGFSMVDGFLGDALIRGHLDHLVGKGDEGSGAGALETLLGKMQVTVLRRLMPRHHEAIRTRALEEARVTRECVGNDIKEITFVDLYMRQRSYIDNNFVQNMHETEPVLPFLSPELIAIKINYPFEDFGRETYAQIFSTHFPALAELGHNRALVNAREAERVSRIHRRWALQILGRSVLRKAPRVLDYSFLVPRLLLAMARPEQAYIVQIAIFAAMLEWLCEANNIKIDWNFDNEVGRP